MVLNEYPERNMPGLTKKYTVLVSAAGSPAAYSLISHLKNSGYYVVGMDSNVDSLQLGESICDQFYLSPLAVSDCYLDFLRSLIKDVDIFIPFIDEELLAIHGTDSADSIRNKTLLCPSSTASICLNKRAFQTFCEENDLNVAPQADAPPAVFKPVFGRGGKGIIMVDDHEMFTRLLDIEGYVAQEMLQGDEYTVDCLYSTSGTLINAVARKRLLASGVSTIGAVCQNKKVLELVERVGDTLNFSGLVNIQIMLSDDIAYLIEINPRISGSIIFSIRAGVDLVDMAIKQALNLPFLNSREVKESKFIRYWQEYEVN